MSVIVGTCHYYDDSAPAAHIYIYTLADGTLTLEHTLDSVRNPQFLAFNKGHLYAVCDAVAGTGPSPAVSATSGAVVSYKWDPAAKTLQFVGSQDTCGRHPCYVSTDAAGAHAFVANYTGSSVAVFPVLADGALGPASDSKYHPGIFDPALADRQECAHPHAIRLDPFAHKWVLVPDLGLDTLFVYEWIPAHGAVAGAINAARHFRFPAGWGPRHIEFHPSLPIVYVLHELSAHVSVLALDPATGHLSSLQDIFGLPEGVAPNRNHHMGSADIHTAHGGRVICVTNRTDATVVAFTVDDKGLLTFASRESTRGKIPRNFLVTPDGTIVLTNQDSKKLAVLHVTPAGQLSFRSEAEVPEPPTFVHLI